MWAGILVLAMLNGALRESLLIPILGEATGLLVSGVLLSVLVLLVAWLTIGWLRPVSTVRAWLVGLVWLVLTLVFEFGFGLVVQHKSLAEMLQAYTLGGGNLWPVVLVVIVLAPSVARRMRMRP